MRIPCLFLIALLTACTGADDPAAICGNGLLDAGEVCDDGNAAGGDGCNASCTSEEYCGNGILDAAIGEQCEDGNTTNGDGCDATCLVEVPPYCGDGVKDAGEGCDDGNVSAGDGCSPACWVEGCGNGFLDPGEACEDGNTASDDGCSADCQIETVVPDGACGDGAPDAGEACDDGNNVAGDGCGPGCWVEECGNPYLDPGEQCEDGNTTNGDGCSTLCLLEPPDIGDGDCGNGVPEPGEACDDGNLAGGDGCSPMCFIEECGNPFLDPGEVCEDGNTLGGDGCSADCLSAEVCGNDILDVGEGCDDGATVSGDGCSAHCTVETEACGDGQIDPGEGCDDGGTAGGDGCSAQCRLETCGDGVVDAGEQCDDADADDTDDCPSTCWQAACGDGFVHTAEECDDANLAPGDGCSVRCTLEMCGNGKLDPGEECDDGDTDSTDGCVECALATCGDDHVHAGIEQCDDGNTDPDDGCSPDCRSDETCGNGIIDAGETCDDSNLYPYDACTAVCLVAECGDGVKRIGHEGCDDGNTDSGDGCSSTCQLEGCGNGAIDGGEECDQGTANGTHGATCFTDCTLIDLDLGDAQIYDLDTRTRGLGPYGIETGDFDGDGTPDLVIANHDSDDVSVLLGFGDGRHWAPHLRDTDNAPRDIVLGHLDDDAYEDAVVALFDGYAVLRGDGTGFAAADSIDTTSDGCAGETDVALADVVGDAALDLVMSCAVSDAVLVLSGDGDGTFTVATLLTTFVAGEGDSPIAIAVGEVTGDALPDLVTANEVSDDVTLFAGVSAGAWAPAEVFTNAVGGGGLSPHDLVLADVSGDQLADVVVANPPTDDVTVLVADGTGGLNLPVRFSTLGASGGGENPQRVAVADVTEDGEPDLVTVNSVTSDVSILAGSFGGATFSAAEVLSTKVGDDGDAPWGLVVTWLDADEHLDIVASSDDEDVAVLLGLGDGAFAPPELYASSIGWEGSNPRALAAGDPNDDGHTDLVVVHHASDDVVVLPGTGDGRLLVSQTRTVGSHPTFPVVADFDGDGSADWAVPEDGDEDFYRAIQNDIGEYPVSVYSFGTTYGDDIHAIAAGNIDPNSDADIDIVGVSFYDGYLTRMLNTGAGSFSSIDAVFSDYAAEHVVLAELTGDSALDALVAIPGDNQVRLHAGNGSGGFGSGTAIETNATSSGQDPVWITVADVTGDAKLDILTANASTNDVTVLRALGSATYAAPLIVPATHGAGEAAVTCVRVGDVNGDGVVDLVTSNSDRATASVILGFGGGAFAAPQAFDVGASPRTVVVADFDGDGRDDLATADYGDDTVTVRLSLGHTPQ